METCITIGYAGGYAEFRISQHGQAETWMLEHREHSMDLTPHYTEWELLSAGHDTPIPPLQQVLQSLRWPQL